MFKTLTAAALAAGCLFVAAPAQAQEQYLGEVRLFGMNWCPRGFLPAEGQLLAISQNTALFSLYGTLYGGDGRTTFALPDLRGRAPVSAGQGPGLPGYSVGQKAGTTAHTLTINEMPPHGHPAFGTGSAADNDSPQGTLLATQGDDFYAAGPANEQMASGAIGNSGGGQAFSIQDPILAMTWCVATQGIFPSRN